MSFIERLICDFVIPIHVFNCYLLSTYFVLDTVSSKREHEDTDQI